VLVSITAPRVNQAELKKKCDESRPAWASYQEDIKGQIGAESVAQWRGRLTELRQNAGTVTATFQLEAPWDRYDASIPVLLRDPMGHECLASKVEKQGTTRNYLFQLATDSGTMILPWVEIHFPNTERRIALGVRGAWKDVQAAP